MQEVYVGRQPIFDRSLSVLGYELLFRHGPEAAFASSAGDRATGRVIVNTFAELGLDRLVGNRCAFINLTRPFLVGTLPLPFSPSDVVLEILETISADDDLLAGLQRLVAAGYLLAIDDFRADDHERTSKLLPFVTYVKVDVLSQTDSELAACVEQCRPYRVHLVAERVEEHETMRHCVDLGFQYFQGYLLGRPAVVSSPGLAPTTVTCMELLNRLSKPNVTFDERDTAAAPSHSPRRRPHPGQRGAARGSRRPPPSHRPAGVARGKPRSGQPR